MNLNPHTMARSPPGSVHVEIKARRLEGVMGIAGIDLTVFEFLDETHRLKILGLSQQLKSIAERCGCIHYEIPKSDKRDSSLHYKRLMHGVVNRHLRTLKWNCCVPDTVNELPTSLRCMDLHIGDKWINTRVLVGLASLEHFTLRVSGQIRSHVIRSLPPRLKTFRLVQEDKILHDGAWHVVSMDSSAARLRLDSLSVQNHIYMETITHPLFSSAHFACMIYSDYRAARGYNLKSIHGMRETLRSVDIVYTFTASGGDGSVALNMVNSLVCCVHLERFKITFHGRRDNAWQNTLSMLDFGLDRYNIAASIEVCDLVSLNVATCLEDRFHCIKGMDFSSPRDAHIDLFDLPFIEGTLKPKEATPMSSVSVAPHRSIGSYMLSEDPSGPRGNCESE